MQWIMSLVILVYPTIADIYKKQFYILPVLVSGIVAMIIGLYGGDCRLLYVILGLMPGLVLLLISFLTREAIGRGDAFVVMTIGMILGWKKTICILFVAFLLAGMFSLFLIVTKKAGRKKSIPFIPFLTAAVVVTCLYSRMN